MIRIDPHGVLDGREVRLFSLENGRGLRLRASEFGTIVTEFHAPDRRGADADIVLGRASLDDYVAGHPWFGATAGRVANRIGGASFTLEGRSYPLAANNGPHSLHGGKKGFDRHVWEGSASEDAEGPSVRFSRVSPDGEEGYPGTLRAAVSYTLTPAGEFRIEMTATTDAPTPVNLVHHGYWNLGGHASGTILDHRLTLASDFYTPADATLLPTGEIAPVAGTPYDFRHGPKMGEKLSLAGGYDTNFILRGQPGRLHPAARVEEPVSGRVMDVLTNEGAIQFYSGNFLDGTLRGKAGVPYPRHGGFCLETQKYPDAIHHPSWPSPVLRPGETYRHVMVHRFSTL